MRCQSNIGKPYTVVNIDIYLYVDQMDRYFVQRTSTESPVSLLRGTVSHDIAHSTTVAW